MTKSFNNSARKLAALGASATGLAALALIAAPPALADHGESEDAAEMTEGEERLARLLEGRVAGEPQNCIRSRLNDRLTVIDDTAYVYGRGRTIYVQRTVHPDRIDSRDTLVSRRFSSSQVCRQDVVTTIDSFNGFFTGAVFFEEFVPYTRVDENDG
ncbi:hypothetical protein [uncultured Erythrobacter sp.]|uniref:hypothetical protein n=1 Tax=uncultured Erythrobacter sp. TaxID=263913 RepID=UPI00260B763C|nr:hypothetical protein [uncultured Erythrobacter sp.]